jgi:hypothetical protein
MASRDASTFAPIEEPCGIRSARCWLMMVTSQMNTAHLLTLSKIVVAMIGAPGCCALPAHSYRECGIARSTALWCALHWGRGRHVLGSEENKERPSLGACRQWTPLKRMAISRRSKLDVADCARLSHRWEALLQAARRLRRQHERLLQQAEGAVPDRRQEQQPTRH